jgi:hypothetical protein
MKSVIFLSQMDFQGKIPRNHNNMRVEFAQMCILEADHANLYKISQIQNKYDVAILLIPKTEVDRNLLQNIDIFAEAKTIAEKVVFMQEGPSWIFQDMSVKQQLWHYNLLARVDGILTENDSDISYFMGLNPTAKIASITSTMVTDNIIHALTNVEKQDKVIIGGNFTRWYGGFDSFVAARHFELPIYAPSMGRRQPDEEMVIQHLPYMPWKDWIYKLAEFKYAVHLMPTIAAGTFAMNCGYLGIPCIGYGDLDTQSNIHPELCVEQGNLYQAIELVEALKIKPFYDYCSKEARKNYEIFHSEGNFKAKMNHYFERLWN